MALLPDLQQRIFAAADQLYQVADKQAFPTVDLVRKLAKVNMNDACSGMRLWRQHQTAQVEPIAADLPAELQQASDNSLQALWRQATMLANLTLQAAQQAWQLERAEAAALNDQIATAFEVQAGELTAAELDRAALADQLADARRQLEQLRCEHQLASDAAEQIRIRLIEVEKRSDDGQRELERLHTVLAATLQEAASTRELQAAQLSETHALLEGLRQHANSDVAGGLDVLAAARQQPAEPKGTVPAPQPGKRARGKPADHHLGDDQA